jgi:hypothetical protein
MRPHVTINCEEGESIMSFSTVKQASQKFPAFSENSLRWIIFNSKLNGATSFIRKVGRKILIDDDAFVSWINEHKEAA